MELRHLKYFKTLAETLHFGKAADKLYIAQPPLSRQIKELESELGIKLFNRNNRNVTLTPAGEYLAEETGKIFYQLTRIEEEIKKIGEGIVGKIRIGYPGAAMYSILPDILKKMHDDFPAITVNLFEMSNENQINMLLTGELDAVFIRQPNNDKDFICKKVFEEDYVLLLPYGHPLGRKKKIKMQMLADEPFISFSKHFCKHIQQNVLKIFYKHKFTPRVKHEASQINTIARLVESGLGYTILPASAVKGQTLDVEIKKLEDVREKAELYLIYSKPNCNFIKNLCRCLPETIRGWK